MAFLAVGAIWLGSGGCSSKPVSPDVAVPGPYATYFVDDGKNVLHRYEPATGVFDSLTEVPFSYPAGFDISPDGKTLYTSGLDSVVAIDIETLSRKWTMYHEGSTGLAASPDGRFLALQGSDLDILELISLTVVYHDTDACGSGSFSGDGSKFYAIAQGGVPPHNDDQHIYCANLDSNTVTRTWISADVGLSQMIPSADGTELYLYGTTDVYQSRFSVYNVDSAAIVYSEYLEPGMGQMDLTADGKYVFYTNPGSVLAGGPDPPFTISVYETATRQRIKEISTVGVFGADTVETNGVIYDIVCTPDSRWLTGISPASRFLSIDIRTLEVIHWERQPQKWFYGLRCQARP
ncbi:MAG: hypothetical protein DRP45_06495 [Candidatus Zixiibacteriota bacterium]|nr:MAG: hypothetical protein DRP45_06495 [candidate division Zixibacteria bacterium]